MCVSFSLHLEYSLEFFIGQVLRLGIRFNTLRELALQFLVLELVSFRVKEAFKWVLVLGLFLSSKLGGMFSLKLGNWISLKPFLGKLRLPLHKLSSELDRFVASINFVNVDVFLTTAISDTVNVFLGSLSSTVDLKFVRFSTDPKVDSVPDIEHHNISIDEILLGVVSNFFAEEESRAVGASEETRLKIRVDSITILS